ncbi:hypothetical protein D3C87_1095860 [compost metagenome]
MEHTTPSSPSLAIRSCTENAMSDEVSRSDALLQQFVAFAAYKNISPKCPTCSSEQGWNILTNQGKFHVVPIGEDRDVLIGAAGIDVLTMRCRNCGFIRMFHLDMIRSWKAETGIDLDGIGEKNERS